MIGEGDTGGEVEKLGSHLGEEDIQLPAYLPCQQDFDFSVPGNGGGVAVLWIKEYGVFGAFAVEGAAFVHQVADKVAAFHQTIL